MVKTLTVTISNHVMDEISDTMAQYGYNNKSELVGELLRMGLLQWKQNKETSISSGTLRNGKK